MNELVLVVDDHPANTKLVTFVLQAHGLKVVAAASAEEALGVLATQTPALILMDVQLPGTDGLELTRQLRNQARFAELPIVAVTAYAMARDEQAAYAAGCNAFVSKPIDTRALGVLVLKLLAARTS